MRIELPVKRLALALLLILSSCATQGESNPYIALSLLNMLMQAQRPVYRPQSTMLCRQTDLGLWCDTF